MAEKTAYVKFGFLIFCIFLGVIFAFFHFSGLIGEPIDNTALVIVNNQPVASSMPSFTINEGESRVVILNGFDPDSSDNLTYSLVSPPLHGKISFFKRLNNNAEEYMYKAVSGFTGADSFTFKVNDGKSDSNYFTVFITVVSAQTIPPAPAVAPVTPAPPVQGGAFSTSTNTQPAPVAIENTTPTPTRVAPPPVVPIVSFDSSVSSYYPATAHLYYLDAAKRPREDAGLNLQQALDKHKILRLENKDYTSIHTAPLIIKSGYRLYGLPNTIVPPLRIEPGTTGALVRSLRPGSLTFPSSPLPTENNVFERIYYADLVVDNAIVQNNLFFDLNYVTIKINTRASGYVRNNRFIKFRAQSVYPQITMEGDVSRKSYGNVFLLFNFLTPGGEAVNIQNQRDLTFVAGDVESWNWNNVTSKSLINTGPMGLLQIFGIQGGGGRSGMFTVGADQFVLISSLINSITSLPHITLLNTNQKSFLAEHDERSINDQAPNQDRLRAFEEFFGSIPRLNGKRLDGIISYLDEFKIKNIVTGFSRTGEAGEVWEKPLYETIPDPAGASWNANLSFKIDSTSDLQDMIDDNEIIPPGTYYISSPLRLRSNQYLIGSGASKTVIISKNPNLNMIVSDEHKNGPGFDPIRIVVADVTLQGGKNGISLTASGVGSYGQVTDSVISHVTMRNMTNAGIYFNDIYGVDNNVFDNVNVVNSGTGLKQEPRVGCVSADSPGITYIDKTYFYESQFVGNQVGFDLPACRANNSVGCVSCLFKNNREAAARFKATNSPVFANSDFVNNGGTEFAPTISNTNTGNNWSNNLLIIGSRFSAGPATSLLGATFVNVEGSTFERSSASNAKIISSPRASFYNSSSSSMPLGNVIDGLFINNNFVGGQMLNSPAAYILGGVIRKLTSGSTATPSSQLLFGSRFSIIR